MRGGAALPERVLGEGLNFWGGAWGGEKEWGGATGWGGAILLSVGGSEGRRTEGGAAEKSCGGFEPRNREGSGGRGPGVRTGLDLGLQDCETADICR